ncbi:MAG: hypothetical protein QOC82_869 [Frankiaceae bacterium]|jgi:hypothetical protein|nr:hypothetical protein [Frankiaceae bacterium]
MRYLNEQQRGPRLVRVTGRDDLGEVVDEGKNIGSVKNLYCVGVHFPATGEVIYYESSRVDTVPPQ